MKAQLKNPGDLQKAFHTFIDEKTKLSKQVDHVQSQILSGHADQLSKTAAIIIDIHFIGEVVAVHNADALKKLVTLLKEQIKDAVIVLAANIQGKASVMYGTPQC